MVCHRGLQGNRKGESQRAQGTHQIPIQVPTHLPLHLVHVLQTKNVLRDHTPTPIRVGSIAYHLGSDHKRRDEQPVAIGSPTGRKADLDPPQQEEAGEQDKVGEAGVMECVGDEAGEGRA
jgi:hypothetical protein